ncbi:MAG: hypothetical protein HYX79_02425 [Chloroflexi bacterium]|nr:hypothetical protein [Chloroflexota bacterium]
MMLPRLVFAILTITMQEVAIALIALLALPSAGVSVPVPALVIFMLAWATGCALVYRAGSRALKRKTLTGLWSLEGGTGKVVTRLTPQGKVRIHDELWDALSSDGAIDVGEEVVVVKQEGLKLLVVRKQKPADQKSSA